MQIRTIDTYTRELDEVAARCDAATFYHSRVWLESLAVTFSRMSLRCLVAEDGGDLAGFLPFFLLKRGPVRVAWSLPFGTYGGPAAVNDRAAAELIEAYAAMLSRPGVVEVGWIDFGRLGPADGWTGQTMETHLIDLAGGFDELWTGSIERQRKKRTRRAKRLGITVRRARSADDVESYYQVYSRRMDMWGGEGGVKYPPGLFVELLERGGDATRLYVAEHDGRVVGGHFNFYFKGMVTAWNGVTSPDSNYLQPGTLLYIHCLREACDEGYEVYNLGASLNKQSLIDFKESLGGVPYTYSSYRRRSLLGKAAALVKQLGG
jgi:CelD/BcsL family acetyltransferase involved in cellulose biosynthesis